MGLCLYSAEPPSQRASNETHFFNTTRAALESSRSWRAPNAEDFFIRLAWHCDYNDRINTSGDTTPRRTLRAGAAAYAMLARCTT